MSVGRLARQGGVWSRRTATHETRPSPTPHDFQKAPKRQRAVLFAKGISLTGLLGATGDGLAAVAGD